MGEVDCCEAFRILSEVGDDPDFYEAQIVRYDPLYEELVKRTGASRGARVLDLGCGTGPTAFKLARIVGREGKIFGLDVNKRMLKYARRKAIALDQGNVEFKMMSMESLRLPVSSFDRVVSCYGICCCFHYARTMKEAFRVLKPGGSIVFSQGCPGRNPIQKAFDGVFSKYKTNRPSLMLRKKREASAVQEKLTRRYQQVSPTLALMRRIGFGECICEVEKHKLNFADAEDYLSYELSESQEYKEMTSQDRLKFWGECIPRLEHFQTAHGLVAVEETAYFSAVK